MKKVLSALLLPFLPLFLSARQQVFSSRSDTAYFQQAYTEMAAMLDGLTPVSIKRAGIPARMGLSGR